MNHLIFITAGLLSGIHVYTYGRWLIKRRNLPGAVLSFAFAAAAAALPVWHLINR